MVSATASRSAFALLILTFLLPVWLMPSFPAIDGGGHVYIAWVMRALATGQCPLLAEYFEFVPYPVPNYAAHAIMALLMGLVSPSVAEKLVISAYITGFPLAFRYLLRAVAPVQRGGEFAAFLLLFNTLFFTGLYNFLLSLTLALFALGFWLRERGAGTRIAPLCVFALLCVCIYFTHLFGLALVLVLAGGITAYDAICALKNHLSLRETMRRTLPGAYLLCAGAVMPALLYGWYAQAEKIPAEMVHSLTARLAVLLNGMLFTPFSLFDGAAMLAGTALFIMFSVIRVRERASCAPHVWLWLAAWMTLLLLILPGSFAGGWLIEMRVAMIVYLCLLLWLAALPLSASGQRMRMLCIVVFSCASLLNLLPNMLRAGDGAASALALQPALTEPAVMLQVFFSDEAAANTLIKGGDMLIPPGHAPGRALAGRCIADSAQFHLGETNTFPVRYRAALHPHCAFGAPCAGRAGMSRMPPPVDPAFYARTTGHPVDYILVWERPAEADITTPLMQQLQRDYTPVLTVPGGLAQLYRRLH